MSKQKNPRRVPIGILHAAPTQELAITGIQPNGDGVTIQWNVETSMVYQLRACTDCQALSTDKTRGSQV